MSGEPTVSVVMPCYDEEANLRRGVLESVARFAEAADYCREVLVVDDGSRDASAELVAAFAATHPEFRLLREPHRGKAGAILAGVAAASGDYVLFCDVDQATPIDELASFRPYMLAGIDVLVGSRAGRREGAPLARRLMARGYILVRRLVLDLGGIADSQCGFKAFRREAIQRIARSLLVYRPGARQAQGATVTAAFDAELLFLARRLGYSMKEVPVRWHHVGTKRVHPLIESWRSLRGLLRIRLNAAQGRYPSPRRGADR
jgi:glycosyltransferase involved in cell wall biosynthesis